MFLVSSIQKKNLFWEIIMYRTKWYNLILAGFSTSQDFLGNKITFLNHYSTHVENNPLPPLSNWLPRS